MKEIVDIAAYRRSVLDVREIREVNPWVPLLAFILGWIMWVRIVYQMAVLDGPIDLTVMGLS